MSLRHFLLALALGLAALPALAVSSGVVEGLQPPAMLLRDGLSFPLVPGTILKRGDRLISGAGGRVLLRLEEGSTVKMGERATLDLDSLVPPWQAGEAYTGSLDIVRGAFRFTTNALSQYRKRDLDVRIGTITAGIRGTDVWGKSDRDGDLFALLEGRVEVRQRDGKPFIMDQPLTYVSVPADGPPTPVAPLPMNRLPGWAAETELDAAAGAVIHEAGRWRLNLGFYRSRAQARTALIFYRSQGYPVEEAAMLRLGKRHIRLVIDHLYSRRAAEALAEQFKTRYGVEAASIQLQP